jgi:hypothetical protein
MSRNLNLLLVSCRHCRRPISVTSEIDDLERDALRRHVRGCAPPDPVKLGIETDELMQHFRIAGAA